MDDTFTLYDLKVEVIATDRPMVCSHKAGDYFLVQGENLVFPKDTSFSMYSLSALLPLLPAKQRPLDPNDWMLSEDVYKRQVRYVSVRKLGVDCAFASIRTVSVWTPMRWGKTYRMSMC